MRTDYFRSNLVRRISHFSSYACRSAQLSLTKGSGSNKQILTSSVAFANGRAINKEHSYCETRRYQRAVQENRKLTAISHNCPSVATQHPSPLSHMSSGEAEENGLPLFLKTLIWESGDRLFNGTLCDLARRKQHPANLIRRSITQRVMWPLLIVVLPPLFNRNARFRFHWKNVFHPGIRTQNGY